MPTVKEMVDAARAASRGTTPPPGGGHGGTIPPTNLFDGYNPAGEWLGVGSITAEYTLNSDGSYWLAVEGVPHMRGSWKIKGTGELELTLGTSVSFVRPARLRPGIFSYPLVQDNGTEDTLYRLLQG